MGQVEWSGRPLLVLQDELIRHGLCQGKDSEAYFPQGRAARNKEGRDRQARYAARLCQGCPVTGECLEYALRAGCDFGVWGGLTEIDRRRVALQGLPPRVGVAA